MVTRAMTNGPRELAIPGEAATAAGRALFARHTETVNEHLTAAGGVMPPGIAWDKIGDEGRDYWEDQGHTALRAGGPLVVATALGERVGEIDASVDGIARDITNLLAARAGELTDTRQWGVRFPTSLWITELDEDDARAAVAWFTKQGAVLVTRDNPDDGWAEVTEPAEVNQ
jgi:hypothetical protein